MTIRVARKTFLELRKPTNSTGDFMSIVLRLRSSLRALKANSPLGFLVVLLLPILGGCWIPEQFDAKVTVAGDGSYSYSYDGVLTFALALADASRGRLDARAESEVGMLAPELREGGFQKAEYLGKGRFSVSYKRTVAKGQSSYFVSQDLQIFSVLPQNDGSLLIGALRPNSQVLRDFSAIGGKIDGTLSVSVASGVKVLKHNAQSEPSFYGYLGSYRWRIKSPDADPLILVRPNG